MFARVASLLALVVFVLLVAASPARASEGPDLGIDASAEVTAPQAVALPKVENPFDLGAYRRNTTRWWAGLALGLVGPPMAVAGGYLGLIGGLSCAFGGTGCGAPLVGGAVLGSLGTAATAVGLALVYSGVWGNVGVLRRGGLDVSVALAVAATVTPLACFAAAVALGAVGQGQIGLGVAIAGYVGFFALSGAQMAVTGEPVAASLSLPKRGPAVSLVPTQVGASPGLVLTARW